MTTKISISNDHAVWVSRAVLLMLAAHSLILGWSATWQSPTLNEPAHLASGVAIWKLGRFDVYRVNPPLVKAVAAIPVVLAGCQSDWHRLAFGPGVRCEFDAGIDFVNANGTNSIRLFNLARWACIPFSLLGGWCCFLWGRSLCGTGSGLLACFLWCINPSILAYGQLIAPDIATSSTVLLASYCFWAWLKRPSWSNATFAGVTLGLALLAKSSWITLSVLWPVIWCCWWFVVDRRTTVANPISTRLSQLVSILLLAVYLLNLGYLFDSTMMRLGDFEFVSQALGAPKADETFGNVFKNSWLANIPVPFPKDFILGIDLQKRDFEAFPFRSYLRGEWRQTGWWYYYIYALGVKIPTGLIGLTILVLCSSIRSWRKMDRKELLGWAILGLPGLLILFIVSYQPTLNHHFRYVLPLFGPMFVFAAMIPVARPSQSLFNRRVLNAVRGICVASMIYSSCATAPRFISYFNLLAGGARQGHHHLIHSNLDWGQDLYFLKEWIERNAKDQPLYLAYHGLFDPSAIGISYLPAPYGPAWNRHQPVAVGTPGLYAISINYVVGDTSRLSPDCDYRLFQDKSPIHICGDTILIYRLEGL